MLCRDQCGGTDISPVLSNAVTDDAVACLRHIYGCRSRTHIAITLYPLALLIHRRLMIEQLPTSETSKLANSASELRISLDKLIRQLRKHAYPGDFTSAQKAVLLRLDRDGPATVSALARMEAVRPQSMRVTVAGLVSIGALSGKSDPSDGRQTLISLAPSFRKNVRATRTAKDDWLFRALQARLSPHEQAELAATVKLLQRLVDF